MEINIVEQKVIWRPYTKKLVGGGALGAGKLSRGVGIMFLLECGMLC